VSGAGVRGLFDVDGEPLSREAGADRAAGPEAAPAAPAQRFAVEDDAPPALTVPPLTALRRHWRAALAIAALAAPLVYGAALWKLRPTYRAEAVLKVSPLVPRLLHTGEEWRASSISGYYSDYVRTLTQLASERSVMEDAVARLDARGADWLPAGVAPSESSNHLRARIDVKLVRDTHLLTIGLDDGRPEVVAPVVEAVTESFLARLAAEDAVDSDSKMHALVQDRDRLKGALAETHARLDGLSSRLGSAILDERQNIFYQRLGVLDEGLTKLFVRRVEAEAALTGAKARALELAAPVPDSLVERLVEEDVAVRDARVLDVRQARELEAATHACAPGHPLRIEAEGRRARARVELAALEAGVRARARARLVEERAEEARQIVAAAERDAQGARSSEGVMEGVLGTARENLVDYGRAMFEGSQLRAESDRLLQSIAGIDRRIEELRIEARAPCRVTVRSAAVTPAKPSRDRRSMALPAALGAALVAGAAAALALARLRPVLLSPEDAASAGVLVLASPEDAGDPLAAADALLRLEADAEGAPLAIVVAPADSGPAAAAAAARFAEALVDVAGARQNALLVRLTGATAAAPGAPAGLAAPPVRAETERGRTTRWGPLAGAQALPSVVATSAFRVRFDGLAAGADARIVATPSPLVSAVSWPFLAQGYRAVLVAAAGESLLPQVGAGMEAVRRARGRLAGLVVTGAPS